MYAHGRLLCEDSTRGSHAEAVTGKASIPSRDQIRSVFIPLPFLIKCDLRLEEETSKSCVLFKPLISDRNGNDDEGLLSVDSTWKA